MLFTYIEDGLFKQFETNTYLFSRKDFYLVDYDRKMKICCNRDNPTVKPICDEYMDDNGYRVIRIHNEELYLEYINLCCKCQ